MKIKNSKISLLFLFICIFCLAYLYVKIPASAQYSTNNYNYYGYPDNYYGYPAQTFSPAYLNNMYLNNYSWQNNQYFGKDINIPTLKINDWIVQPKYGNTIYAVSNDGGALTVYGTYFSAHTHAGVNFNRTLFMDGSLYSATNQTSFTSPVSYYARQVLQFSPVLHGPLLNKY